MGPVMGRVLAAKVVAGQARDREIAGAVGAAQRPRPDVFYGGETGGLTLLPRPLVPGLAAAPEAAAFLAFDELLYFPEIASSAPGIFRKSSSVMIFMRPLASSVSQLPAGISVLSASSPRQETDQNRPSRNATDGCQLPPTISFQALYGVPSFPQNAGLASGGMSVNFALGRMRQKAVSPRTRS